MNRDETEEVWGKIHLNDKVEIEYEIDDYTLKKVGVLGLRTKRQRIIISIKGRVYSLDLRGVGVTPPDYDFIEAEFPWKHVPNLETFIPYERIKSYVLNPDDREEDQVESEEEVEQGEKERD